MSETPKCPGCGAKMVLIEDFHKYFYVCLDCGWKSPYGRSEKEGLDLALKRAEPENRVLTYDELRSYVGLMWFEFTRLDHRRAGAPMYSHGGYNFQWDTTPNAPITEENIEAGRRNYNLVFRCWLRKPTEEEQANVPWRE